MLTNSQDALRGQSRLKITEHGTIRYVRYGFLLVLLFYSNFFPKMHSFWDIWLRKMLWTWNPGQRLLKFIGTDTDWSTTYDFLL